MLGFGATKLIYFRFSLFRILEQCYLGAVFLSLPFVLVWLISFCSVTIQLVLLAIALAFLPLFIVFRYSNLFKDVGLGVELCRELIMIAPSRT